MNVRSCERLLTVHLFCAIHTTVAKRKTKTLDLTVPPQPADLADWFVGILCDLTLKIRQSPFDKGLQAQASSIATLAKAAHAFTSTIELQQNLIELEARFETMKRTGEQSAGIDYAAVVAAARTDN